MIRLKRRNWHALIASWRTLLCSSQYYFASSQSKLFYRVELTRLNALGKYAFLRRCDIKITCSLLWTANRFNLRHLHSFRIGFGCGREEYLHSILTWRTSEIQDMSMNWEWNYYLVLHLDANGENREAFSPLLMAFGMSFHYVLAADLILSSTCCWRTSIRVSYRRIALFSIHKIGIGMLASFARQRRFQHCIARGVRYELRASLALAE